MSLDQYIVDYYVSIFVVSMNGELIILHRLCPFSTSNGLIHAYIDATDYTNVGMVYGMEFIPWVDNPSFQIASKILTEDMKIPMSRSLITRVIANRNGPSVFVNSNVARSQFKYKDPSYHMDKYGYCCESIVVFDRKTNTYNTEH